jgi:hypothetical protein
MLSECHRVLKNNGKIRISTPDLQFLIDLYRDNKSELQRQYIKWATDERIKGAPCYDETFVINSLSETGGTCSFMMKRHYVHPWRKQDSPRLLGAI